MNWPLIIGGAIVLGVLVGLLKWIRMFLLAFIGAVAVLVYLQTRVDPTVATPLLAVLGGGLVLGMPIRRILRGGWL